MTKQYFATGLLFLVACSAAAWTGAAVNTTAPSLQPPSPAAAAQDLEIEIDRRIRIEIGIDDYDDLDIDFYPRISPSLYEAIGPVVYLSEDIPPGKYEMEVEATIVDWENRVFDKQRGFVEFTIGAKPDDPDDPDPPGPVDPTELDYLKEKVVQWSSSIPDGDNKKAEAKILCDVFRKYAGQTANYENIRDFTMATSDEYKAELGVAAYNEWRDPVFSPMTDELRMLRDDKGYNTVLQYAAIWSVLADGFEEVANE